MTGRAAASAIGYSLTMALFYLFISGGEMFTQPETASLAWTATAAEKTFT